MLVEAGKAFPSFCENIIVIHMPVDASAIFQMWDADGEINRRWPHGDAAVVCKTKRFDKPCKYPFLV